MKKTLHFSTVLLALVLLAGLFCFAGCGKSDEVPDGMMSVTCAGANYRLFVPENWTPKTGSGISGAFVTLRSLSDVSVYQKTVPAGTTAADFWAGCLADYTLRYPDLEILNSSENAMGGLDAPVYVFGFTRGEEQLRLMQVTAVSEKTQTAYVFLFTATPEMYDAYIEQIYEIVSQILLDQPPQAAGKWEAAAPASTPDGMICVSGKNVAYYFFVPQSWEPLTGSEIADARAPGDPTNVSLTVYIDDEVTEPDQYLAKMTDAYAADGYQIGAVTQTDATMGGVAGKTFTYDLTFEGEVYRLSQTVVMQDDFLFGPTAFVLTCTSTPELFESHAAELDAMRDAFLFR